MITEEYVAEVFVPVNHQSTGLALLNGTAVAGNVTAILYDSNGAPIVQSASTAQSGTAAYQDFPFASTYNAVTSDGEVICSGRSMRYALGASPKQAAFIVTLAGMLLFVLACGLAVTLGLMNFVNLAHGAFAMVGGYVCVSLLNKAGVPFLLALPLAAVASSQRPMSL